MQCPNDGATLLMSERHGVEIDYCPTCRGVWLDRGELDKIVERAEHKKSGGGAGREGEDEEADAPRAPRGAGGSPPPRPPPPPPPPSCGRGGYEPRHEPRYEERYDPRYGRKKKRKSFLDDLF